MKRLDKIRAKMQEAGAEALLVTSRSNRRYVTGFNSSEGVVLLTKEKAYYIVDSRYIEAATKLANEGITVQLLAETFMKDLGKMVEQLRIQKLAFEDHSLSVFELAQYEAAVKVQFVPMGMGIERVRQNKEPGEIEFVKKAQSIAETAFAAALPQFKIGMSEKEVATLLMHEMNKNGGEGLSFPVIAVSGPNSSLPHGVPSDRKLQDGDFLTMDFGVIYHGYCSDMTRTIAIGHVTEEMQKVYDTVLKAQLHALECAKVGMRGVEVDALARDIITEAGYGKNFQHGLGHCVGIDVHEDPRANMVDQSCFEVGHLLTIEPGIYLPGKFGVRIEDMLYFGENGTENLTHTTKELILIK